MNLFLSLNATYAAIGIRIPITIRRICIGARANPSGINRGKNAHSTISGMPINTHHLPLPEYSIMQKELTPASTSSATKLEQVSVRINSRIAIPAINISHPERPSRYSINMNPTYTKADPVSLCMIMMPIGTNIISAVIKKSFMRLIL